MGSLHVVQKKDEAEKTEDAVQMRFINAAGKQVLVIFKQRPIGFMYKMDKAGCNSLQLKQFLGPRNLLLVHFEPTLIRIDLKHIAVSD